MRAGWDSNPSPSGDITRKSSLFLKIFNENDRDEVSWSEMLMFLLSTATFSLFKISIPKFKFK